MSAAQATPRSGWPSRWSRAAFAPGARSARIGRRRDIPSEDTEPLRTVRIDAITLLIVPPPAPNDTAGALAGGRLARAAAGECCVVVDLVSATSLDDSVARSLVRLSTLLAARGGGLAVIARGPGVLAALAQADGDARVSTYPTQAEALARVRGRLTPRTSSGVLSGGASFPK